MDQITQVITYIQEVLIGLCLHLTLMAVVLACSMCVRLATSAAMA